MSNGNVMTTHLITGLIKKILIILYNICNIIYYFIYYFYILFYINLNNISYCPKPDSCGRNRLKIQLDLFNYPTRSDVKNATGVDISEFAI